MKRQFCISILVLFLVLPQITFAQEEQEDTSKTYRLHVFYAEQNGYISSKEYHILMKLKGKVETNGLESVVFEDSSVSYFTRNLISRKEAEKLIAEINADSSLQRTFLVIQSGETIYLPNEIYFSNVPIRSPKANINKRSEGVQFMHSVFKNESGIKEGTQVYWDNIKWNWITASQNTLMVTILFYNPTDKEVRLSANPGSPNIQVSTSKYILSPKSTTKITVEITAQSGEKYLPITFSNDRIQAEFIFKVFGYDLSSNDLKPNTKNQVSSGQYYYRSGSEALLKFYDIKKEKVMLVISLSKEITKLNFDELKPGSYWLEKVDFKSGTSTFSEVLIK